MNSHVRHHVLNCPYALPDDTLAELAGLLRDRRGITANTHDAVAYAERALARGGLVTDGAPADATHAVWTMHLDDDGDDCLVRLDRVLPPVSPDDRRMARSLARGIIAACGEDDTKGAAIIRAARARRAVAADEASEDVEG